MKKWYQYKKVFILFLVIGAWIAIYKLKTRDVTEVILADTTSFIDKTSFILIILPVIVLSLDAILQDEFNPYRVLRGTSKKEICKSKLLKLLKFSLYASIYMCLLNFLFYLVFNISNFSVQDIIYMIIFITCCFEIIYIISILFYILFVSIRIKYIAPILVWLIISIITLILKIVKSTMENFEVYNLMRGISFYEDGKLHYFPTLALICDLGIIITLMIVISFKYTKKLEVLDIR